MKIEDIKYEFEDRFVDDKNFDLQQWRKENPIDYYKIIYGILSSLEDYSLTTINGGSNEIFKNLYKICRLYVPNFLYKYSSFTDDIELNKKKLSTLREGKIYMSDIKDFNDPFDGMAFFYNHKELGKIEELNSIDGKIIDNFRDFYKGAAFTTNDVNSMPMWAHYANNHNGFCVVYDMTDKRNDLLSTFTFPIQYTDERLDITSYMKKYVEKIIFEIRKGGKNVEECLRNDLSLIFISIFLSNIKHSSWSYENEFRCSKTDASDYLEAFPNEICVGLNCTIENQEKLVEIAKELNIPIYKMRFEEFSEYFILKKELLFGKK